VAPCSSARGHRLLNVEDVARCLDVTPRWVYAEANAGRLPHVKVGRFFRFKPESIEDWLAANERGTVG
jgi:excisionase family DNA binding protein